jgi:hypothetical protein
VETVLGFQNRNPFQPELFILFCALGENWVGKSTHRSLASEWTLLDLGGLPGRADSTPKLLPLLSRGWTASFTRNLGRKREQTGGTASFSPLGATWRPADRCLLCI